jgi:opacity protein-like surface antigen
MLRKRSVVLSAFAAMSSFAIASGASADGVESVKDGPAPVEDYVWDGLYVGVGIGAGSFDHDVDVDSSKTKTLKMRDKYDCDWKTIWGPHTIDKSTSFGDDDWNVFGTMQIGYDRLVHNRFLIGAFADFDFYQDADDSFSEPWIKSFGKWKQEIASIDGNIELDHVWSIGGRLGILVTPRILLYAVGGYSEASLDGSVDVNFKHGPTLSLAAPDELQGYFLGGGAEFKLRENVSLKFEYRYTKLDGDSASASDTDSDSWTKWCKEYELTKDYNAHADFDADIQSIRAVLVLKFDEPERPVAALK